MDIKTDVKFIDNFEVETPEGFKKFTGIGKICQKVPILKIILANGNFIEVSVDHPFIICGNVELAKNLIEGDCLETKEGLVEITRIELNEADEEVYTLLEVKSSDHSYYTNDIISQNCKFIGSKSTLIDSDVLERIIFKEPVMVKWEGIFKIYEPPQKHSRYVIGVDTGKGTSLNYSVIQVLKIDDPKNIQQVGIYRNNLIMPHDFSQVCISISDYYNKAMMMIENNSIGSSVCDTIWYEYENENIVNLDPKGLGVRSTKTTKLRANMLLKEYMDKGLLTICDEDTIYELSKYEEITPDVYSAGRNENDDCVTSLLWALFYIISDEYKDMAVEETSGEIEEKFQIDSKERITGRVYADGQKQSYAENFEPTVFFD